MIKQDGVLKRTCLIKYIKMKQTFLLFIIGLMALSLKAQMYFPPNNSNAWDTIAPSNLEWCTSKIDSLYNFLEENHTKAFLLLKDGKIVLEQYFDEHSASSNWYWASAGKSLTALMVGLAQEENYLDISDTTSKYLGQGWTSCTPAQEDKITIWNQLTMTTGLDDDVADPYCTSNTCLHYLAAAGTRWAYHNAPYTLLDNVIENATGQTLNQYTNQKLKTTIGMDGLYIPQGYNNVFFSTARSMARFGLLILNQGIWNGTPILSDTNYFNEMVQTSQNLNESYGYLWWLNGKNSFMIPQSQFVFQGSMMPNAPDDMVAALGKNGQFINIIPSQNMVWIRMGDAPDNTLVPFTFNDEIWEYINDLDCGSLDITEQEVDKPDFFVFPNPVKDFLYINSESTEIGRTSYSLYNVFGQLMLNGEFSGNHHQLNLEMMLSGMYLLELRNEMNTQTIRIINE